MCKKPNFTVKMIKYQQVLPRKYPIFILEGIQNLTEQMLEQSDLTLKLTSLLARRLDLIILILPIIIIQ